MGTNRQSIGATLTSLEWRTPEGDQPRQRAQDSGNSPAPGCRIDGESRTGGPPVRAESLRHGLGHARLGAQSAHVPLGTDRAAMGDPRAGARFVGAAAAAFAGHDHTGLRYWSASVEHYGVGVEPRGCDKAHGVHSCHPGKGTARHRCSTEHGRACSARTVAGETRALRVCLQAPRTHQASVDPEMARVRQGGRSRRLSFSRSAPHLGELAGASRNAIVAPAGARWLGVLFHGATVRAPVTRASQTICESDAAGGGASRGIEHSR